MAGTRPKTERKLGPPTKKNEGVVKRLVAAARLGLPYAIVSTRAGITRETLNQWRHADPDLDRRLEEARAEAAEEAWLKIMAAGDTGLPNAWQSIAWRLERSHPESFGRPEVQLNAQFNSQTNNVNATIVISAEQASHLRQRNSVIDKELDELARNHEAKQKQLNGSNAQEVVREVESSLVPSTSAITLPAAARRGPSWWGQLSSGDGSRGIAAAAADYALRAIVTEVAGGARAGGLKVSWDNEVPTLSELWSAISEACGGAGWGALVARGSSRP